MRDLFYLIPSALTDEEISAIKTSAEAMKGQDGTVFSSAYNSHQIRNSTVKWLKDDALRLRLWAFVKQANQAAFDVDVTERADLQYTIYEGSKAGHYDWHHDVHWASQDEWARKLSVTVQLSAPDDYEGGRFEFDEVKSSADFSAKGSVLIFPSYLSHKVHPVTSGTRHALVAWFFGPRWR